MSSIDLAIRASGLKSGISVLVFVLTLESTAAGLLVVGTLEDFREQAAVWRPVTAPLAHY
jgi:hypothetical protein